tara:strand:+ start:22237 stop:22560 length:324 start_codon:yes stop_codon:yes gene_type:complete
MMFTHTTVREPRDTDRANDATSLVAARRYWRDFRGEDEGRGAIVTVDDAALIRYGHAVPPRRRMRWRMKSRKYVNVFQAAARRWVAGSLNTVKRKEKILKVSVNVLQ